jgi:hypothetical protein
MALALTFLSDTTKMAMKLLIHTLRVTGDETWVSFANVETKEQSKQWMQTHPPNKSKKFKQTSARKLMATVFCDRKGVLMMDFTQQGTTTTSEMYYETLNKLCRAIQKKGVEC